MYCRLSAAINKKPSVTAWIAFLLFTLIHFPRHVVCQEKEQVFDFVDDSSTFEEILRPQLSFRLAPFAGNETLNKSRLSNARSRKNDKGIQVAANNLGYIYMKQGKAGLALPYFLESLEASRRTGQTKSTLVCLIQTGVAEQQLGHFDLALKYYDEAISLGKGADLPAANAFAYAQKGICHKLTGDAGKANESFNSAAKLYTGLGEKSQASVCYNLKGEVFLRSNEFKQATEAFNAGLSVLIGEKEYKLRGILLRNLGLTEFKRGRFESALDYFNRSLAFDNQMIIHKLVKDTYMQLFTYYSYSNDFVKADRYHDKYRNIKDSLENVMKRNGSSNRISLKEELAQKEQIIELLQKRFLEEAESSSARQLELSQMITKADIELQQKDQALEEKSSEVEKLTKENAIRERDMARQELLLDRQRHFRNLLIAILIGALLLAGLFYNRYKLKKNSNAQLRDANKELEGALKQLHETQDQLVQSEKMASLGQLTAGIAHEIQNPLNFVNNFSEGAIDIANEALDADSEEERKELINEIKGSLQKIHEHGKRADRIVKSMLQHSRQGSGEKETVNINHLVRESVHLAYHGMRATFKDFRSEIDEQLDQAIPDVPVVPQDLNRVVLNIANNAFYAMREQTLKNHGLRAHLKVSTIQENGSVKIRIRDNGSGIPKTIIEKIFQPFYTTKPSGQGTGLGLSMSYDIIRAHGGNLEVQSEPGQFTEFCITIPVKPVNA
jgi:signal transduction histidine kinase